MPAPVIQIPAVPPTACMQERAEPTLRGNRVRDLLHYLDEIRLQLALANEDKDCLRRWWAEVEETIHMNERDTP